MCYVRQLWRNEKQFNEGEALSVLKVDSKKYVNVKGTERSKRINSNKCLFNVVLLYFPQLHGSLCKKLYALTWPRHSVTSDVQKQTTSSLI